ncbi:hypothetical protein CFP65_5330 [Kitasatospora sp. MMS16-BH015]|uniref:single-stranded DNA-binding protein n=1 Tax=Kitasatospora sp. MMS16-BH015 TaxID=2018025 RepID=UPI000CA14CAF|nr:single-stranded DNA-binding protein [Kitasatospora sp. MMS16-BH015]AUG80038.1 hypothetical protein CFP65_5330 [Kitasatospora sp. MMS16-BH015]
MNETSVTMVGNVASGVSYKQTPAGVPVANFRMATTERRFDRSAGDWIDGETIWVTVVAWRWLATNVVSSLNKGDPVVVSGRLRVREWGEEEKKHTAIEIDARVVGHDLGRGTSAFRWAVQARPELVAGRAGPEEQPVLAASVSTAASVPVPAAAAVGVPPGEVVPPPVVAVPAPAARAAPLAAAPAAPAPAPLPGGAEPVEDALPAWIVAAVEGRRAEGVVIGGSGISSGISSGAGDALGGGTDPEVRAAGAVVQAAEEVIGAAREDADGDIACTDRVPVG